MNRDRLSRAASAAEQLSGALWEVLREQVESGDASGAGELTRRLIDVCESFGVVAAARGAAAPADSASIGEDDERSTGRAEDSVRLGLVESIEPEALARDESSEREAPNRVDFDPRSPEPHAVPGSRRVPEDEQLSPFSQSFRASEDEQLSRFSRSYRASEDEQLSRFSRSYRASEDEQLSPFSQSYRASEDEQPSSFSPSHHVPLSEQPSPFFTTPTAALVDEYEDGSTPIAVKDVRAGGHPPVTAAVQRRLERHALDGAPFAVLLVEVLDVERLRTLRPGGEVLREIWAVESAIAEQLRPADTLLREIDGRWWLIAPDTDAAATRQLAERLAATARRFAHRGAPLRVVIGIAVCPDHGLDAPALIGHADVDLYAAQAAGRSIGGGFDEDPQPA